jgi:hypothetical protein
MKSGDYPLRSSQSRAAARTLVEARNAREEGIHFQVVSILDGKPINLEGLAERIAGRRVLIHDIPRPANEERQLAVRNAESFVPRATRNVRIADDPDEIHSGSRIEPQSSNMKVVKPHATGESRRI